MRWLRDAGWVVAAGALIALAFTRPDRKQLPDPNESRAAFEKKRAEFDEKLARREQETEAIRNEGTLDRLRLVGQTYRRHLAVAKAPPREDDYPEFLDLWRSRRDDRPLVIVWGVDLGQLPGGGAGQLLAWEQSGRGGTRCVLMADGKTAKVVAEEEFAKLPRAK